MPQDGATLPDEACRTPFMLSQNPLAENRLVLSFRV